MCVVMVEAPGLRPTGAPMGQRAHASAGVRHLRGAACAAPAGLPRSTRPAHHAIGTGDRRHGTLQDLKPHKKHSYLRTMDLG